MIDQFEIDETFGDCLIFSDESTFKLSGKAKMKKCSHLGN
jgi:hypothetical protein